jgi:hypothetical protein
LAAVPPVFPEFLEIPLQVEPVGCRGGLIA